MRLHYFFYLFMGLITVVNAQDPLYNYTFTGGLQDWTSNSIECGGQESDEAQWLWVGDGLIDQGAYFDFGLMNSRTPDSGIVVLNSDFLDNNGQVDNEGKGNCPVSQIAELVSPTLDFSDEESVFLSFNQLYLRQFGYQNEAKEIFNGFSTATFVAVSKDGGENWNEIPVNEDLEVLRYSNNPDTELTLDISDMAAGESNVLIKFIWKGDYFFWAIDDVRLYGERKNDLEITAFKYPLSNFRTPGYVIRHDTMRFVADVVNLGSETVDSAYLYIIIADNKANNPAVHFRDSILIQDLKQNDTLIDVTLPNYFIPENFTPGSYAFIYRLRNTKRPVEVNIANNIRNDVMLVSENSFNKTDRADYLGLLLNNDGIIGNYYAINENIQDRILLDNINFSVDPFNKQADITLAGKEVIVYLLKIDDDVADDLSDWNLSEATENKKSIVGIGSYLFTEQDDADSRGLNHRFEVKDMINLEDTDGPIVLEPGSRYIAAVEYKDDAVDIMPGFSTRFAYYPYLGSDQISTMLYDYDQKRWYQYGIGLGYVAVIGMDVKVEMTATEDLLTDTEVRIFPNPTSDYIRIRMNLEHPQDVNVYLTDVSGKMLNVTTRSKFISGTVEVNVQSVPAGTYFLNVTSADGMRTEKISVVH